MKDAGGHLGSQGRMWQQALPDCARDQPRRGWRSPDDSVAMSDSPPTLAATPPCSLALASGEARRRWTPSQWRALMGVDRSTAGRRIALTGAPREGARMWARNARVAIAGGSKGRSR
jgi:hypothetical protein